MTKLMNKPDLQELAQKIIDKGQSSDRHIEDTITEMLLNRINPQLEAWTEEVLEIMQELEHPEPSTKAEYDERIGADKE